MNKEDIEKHYSENKSQYENLADNIKQALKTFFGENNISFHSISSRIKELESYIEKIDRKGYENPIEQIEDFCGVRIICYYPLDLDKIATIINDEFEVIESIDKSANMEADRFGYRSNHYIVKIKKDWLKAPNYRGLEHLKAEIQVRTILMHSWADIEHKLAYKKQDDIPKEFRRKLYQLSALLEIADAQFQELKNNKENFKSSLIKSDKEGSDFFDIKSDLNLDSLQAYLDFNFPDRKKIDTSDLLEELKKLGISLEEIERYRVETIDILPKVEEEIMTEGRMFQIGIIRALLDLKSDIYWKKRPEKMKESHWGEVMQKWRKKIPLSN
ncbi:(p)ppGpp synthetase [Chryseobacterium sp. G0162]|uniref:GTP pyrophosphokinase n=1 Tax=Chryseobacterium sp. G0162 TaxID=2487063 RepID=UPI000F4F1789|nr:(p)ppGpp synthetase [Chryseobacterium sp. G0162]AZB09969.1 (p)ppGpp synthetase [Chryseobacterium sp. G0162]